MVIFPFRSVTFPRYQQRTERGPFCEFSAANSSLNESENFDDKIWMYYLTNRISAVEANWSRLCDRKRVCVSVKLCMRHFLIFISTIECRAWLMSPMWGETGLRCTFFGILYIHINYQKFLIHYGRRRVFSSQENHVVYNSLFINKRQWYHPLNKILEYMAWSRMPGDYLFGDIWFIFWYL